MADCDPTGGARLLRCVDAPSWEIPTMVGRVDAFDWVTGAQLRAAVENPRSPGWAWDSTVGAGALVLYRDTPLVTKSHDQG